MRMNVNLDPLWDAAERMLPPGNVRGRLRILIDRNGLRSCETDGVILVFANDPDQASDLAGKIRRLGLASHVDVVGTQLTIRPGRAAS